MKALSKRLRIYISYVCLRRMFDREKPEFELSATIDRNQVRVEALDRHFT